MRKVENLIPEAIQVIAEVEIPTENSLTVDKEFKGYFASFGASIVQSGLLPATIFFENEDSDAQAKREKVPLAILYLLKKKNGNDPALKAAKRLSEYILKAQKSYSKLLKEVSQASVALKIALRTYNLNSETQNEPDHE